MRGLEKLSFATLELLNHDLRLKCREFALSYADAITQECSTAPEKFSVLLETHQQLCQVELYLSMHKAAAELRVLMS